MKFALGTLLVLALASGSFAERVVTCYWGTWANYRPGNGKFEVSNIDPNLCTHLIYTFFGIDDQGNFRMLDTWLDVDLGFMKKAVALKNVNPRLKVLVAVGGWNEGSIKYSSMAADANKRRNFIDSTMRVIQEYGFDGLDLDWEYPAQRGGSPADKQNFVTLLREIRERFNQHGLELSIAVGATEASASQSYDIPAVSQHVHYINVMTYDFNGAWEPVTGFNAPLRGSGPNNVEASIDYWLRMGAPANKLVMGIPFYGRTFRLANSQNYAPGSAAYGGGSAGPYTRESSYLGYNEICESLNTYRVYWDNTAQCPYAVRGDDWVGYDNVQSINDKLSYLLSKNLAGAMVWSLETDDFRGICGERYPLLRTINNRLH